MSQKQDSAQDVITTLRIPRELHQQIREIAVKERRTMAGQLRWLIERGIADAGVREAA